MAKVKINITVDEGLLSRIDEYVEANSLSRSGLFNQSVSSFLDGKELTKAIKLMSLAMRKIADTGEIDEASRKQFEYFEGLAKMLSGQ